MDMYETEIRDKGNGREQSCRSLTCHKIVLTSLAQKSQCDPLTDLRYSWFWCRPPMLPVVVPFDVCPVPDSQTRLRQDAAFYSLLFDLAFEPWNVCNVP
jgi:hypothetical protein